jgi:hypothetical protein
MGEILRFTRPGMRTMAKYHTLKNDKQESFSATC